MIQLPLKMFRRITLSKFFNGTPCWIWIGGRSSGGYGYVRFNGKMQIAHRVIYELLVGPIPKGLDLDHLCRNRACCNPEHLEPVTRKENVRRGDGIKATIKRHQKHRENTHCPYGHEYTPENTYNYKGGRSCNQCRKEHSKNSKIRKKNQVCQN